MWDRTNVTILAVGIALMVALVLGVQAGERVAAERMEAIATTTLGLR